MRWKTVVFSAAGRLLLSPMAWPASPSAQESQPGSHAASPGLIMDPANGRKLFAAKGCVACHAVNGVGGQDAPAPDASTMPGMDMNNMKNMNMNGQTDTGN